MKSRTFIFISLMLMSASVLACSPPPAKALNLDNITKSIKISTSSNSIPMLRSKDGSYKIVNKPEWLFIQAHNYGDNGYHYSFDKWDTYTSKDGVTKNTPSSFKVKIKSEEKRLDLDIELKKISLNSVKKLFKMKSDCPPLPYLDIQIDK